ncbi:MAG: hypothetical protein ACHQ1G_07590 [Planctomycetota bacterium]
MTNTTTAPQTTLSFQSSMDGMIHVHSAGCGEIGKPTGKDRRCGFNAKPWTATGPNADAILQRETAQMNADFESDNAIADLFHVFPCVAR